MNFGGMIMISGGMTMTKWRDEGDYRRDELTPANFRVW